MDALWIALLVIVAANAVLVGFIVGRRRASRRDSAVSSLPHAPTAVAVGLEGVGEVATPSSPRPNELVLGAPEAPAISVRALPPDLEARGREPVSLPPSTKTALAPLLQHAPRVLVEGAAAGRSVVGLAMVFSPETTKAVSEGVLQLTPSASMDGAVRAIARSADGKFVEHANLMTKVNPAAVVTAVWQVAALVTAQKFLADINARLATIEKGVAAILEFLEDQVSAELHADLAYLRDRAETLQAGTVSERELAVIVQALDDIDRRGRARADLATRRLARHRAKVASGSWSATWSAAEQETAARTAIGEAENRAAIGLLAVQLRLLAVAVRSGLNLQGEFTMRAAQAATTDLERLREEWSAFDRSVADKLVEIGATFQRAETDRKQRLAVRAALVDTTLRLNEGTGSTLSTAEQLRRTMLSAARDAERPLELLVEVDQSGQVLRADRMLPA